MVQQPSPAIVVLVSDLMFAERIERGLAALGYVPVLVPTADAFAEAVRTHKPALALVDTGIRGVDWAGAIQHTAADVPVLAFGSHLDLTARQRALERGAVNVVANSKLAADLAGLVARYARAGTR
jgi:DNA-binding response OmpR family regulator